MNEYIIIVDGSNVAFCHKNDKNKAMLSNLELLIEFLENLEGQYRLNHEIIIDASLKYRIDRRSKLEKYLRQGKINESPAGTQADQFILEYYNMEPSRTIIISNDNFRDYNFVAKEEFSLCKFMIINGKFLIPGLQAVLKILSESETAVNTAFAANSA
ncbi:MAG: NYN domain-containing protein [Candidatus Helarchaeales archaeon]